MRKKFLFISSIVVNLVVLYVLNQSAIKDFWLNPTKDTSNWISCIVSIWYNCFCLYRFLDFVFKRWSKKSKTGDDSVS